MMLELWQVANACHMADLTLPWTCSVQGVCENGFLYGSLVKVEVLSRANPVWGLVGFVLHCC